MSIAITWLGHATFVIRLPSGQRLVTDPWLSGPSVPPEWSRIDALAPVHAILVSHGHSDHSLDAEALSRATGAPVICLAELGDYLSSKGVQNVRGMNIGGTQTIAGIRITMTAAVHSGSIVEHGRIVYLGGAAGFVIRAADAPTIYFAGDTALFGDMKIIRELGTRPTLRSCRLAITTRWDRKTPRSPPSGSACARSCRCIGERFRC